MLWVTSLRHWSYFLVGSSGSLWQVLRSPLALGLLCYFDNCRLRHRTQQIQHNIIRLRKIHKEEKEYMHYPYTPPWRKVLYLTNHGSTRLKECSFVVPVECASSHFNLIISFHQRLNLIISSSCFLIICPLSRYGSFKIVSFNSPHLVQFI